MSQVTSTPPYYRYWFWTVGILICLGIVFRIIHLDQPVYWVDEVATSMRVSGYTQADVTQQFATGTLLSPADILHVQQINPDRSILHLFSVLSQSPEHAPLYFVLMRLWSEIFGTSVTAMRSLSVVFSLLALPAIFSLCHTLFKDQLERPQINPIGWGDPRKPNRSPKADGDVKAEGRFRREMAEEPTPSPSQEGDRSIPTPQLPNSSTPQRPNAFSKIQNLKSKIPLTSLSQEGDRSIPTPQFPNSSTPQRPNAFSKIQNPKSKIPLTSLSQEGDRSIPTPRLPNSSTPQRPNAFSKIQNLKSKIPLTATAFLAISPFFISYAQEARPYSLWVLLLLIWHQLLWRSLHTNRLASWLGYALALTLSLYTSLLTVLVMAGQGFAVMLLSRQRWRPYLITTGMALVAFSPWLWVIATHWQTLQDNTSWMQEPMPLWALFGVWFYGLSVLFFDVPVAAGMPVVLVGQMLTSLVVMVVMIYAVYALMTDAPSQGRGIRQDHSPFSRRMGKTNVCPSAKSLTRPHRTIGLFLFLGALGPPMTLLLLDLIRDGQSAATPRYLMPMHLAVLIAVAYMVSDRLFYRPFAFASSSSSLPDLPQKLPAHSFRFWPQLTAVLLSISLFSCLIGVTHTSDYQKSRNLSNPTITAFINQAQAPLVMTESDNIQDVISLSYELNPDVRFFILPSQATPEQWLSVLMSSEHPFLFNPSDQMQQQIKAQHIGTLTPIYQPAKLIASELGLTLWRLDSTLQSPVKNNNA